MIEDLDGFLDFKKKTRANKMKLLKGITVVEFTRNQTLYDEGQSSDCMYFLLEGEFEVSKNFKISNKEDRVDIEFHKMKPSVSFEEMLEHVSLLPTFFSNIFPCQNYIKIGRHGELCARKQEYFR